MGQALLYFEDFVPGTIETYGPLSVSAKEIIAFAREYDPQPMHIDAVAAKETMFGGLVASGWHSCCLFMRLMCDGFLLKSASLGAPGVDEVKFLKPVRPGDQLSLQTTVNDRRVSASRPYMGFVSFSFVLINHKNERVLTMQNVIMIRRRAADGGS